MTKINDSSQIFDERPGEMTSAWRVMSFFIVIFVLPTILISFPLYARYYMYGTKLLLFTDGDMRSFQDDVSSFWCQGQSIRSNGSFEAYLMKDVNRIRKKYRTHHLASDLFLSEDMAEEWGIHLIKGSKFTFSSCARWPGGTLVVVQGEENLRRCFYREDRFEDELNDDEDHKGHAVKVEGQPVEITSDHQPLDGANEIVDDEDINISKDELIQRLYSVDSPPEAHSTKSTSLSTTSKYTKSVATNSNKIHYQTTSFTTQSRPYSSTTLKSKTYSANPTETSISEDSATFLPDIQKLSRVRRYFEKKRKKQDYDERKDLLQIINHDEFNNKTNIHKNLSSIKHEESEEHSFFFNVNDTMDVTAGNSSYSSSEEFLSQCKDTIVSIDLSPYINCSNIASVNNKNTDYWTFRVNKTDFYYFIFTSDNSIEKNVISFRLLLKRILYNVTNPIQKCANKSECRFPFEFMKKVGVIVDFNSVDKNISKLEDLKTYELTSICQPRSLVYTIFILFVPFIIILFAFR